MLEQTIKNKSLTKEEKDLFLNKYKDFEISDSEDSMIDIEDKTNKQKNLNLINLILTELLVL